MTISKTHPPLPKRDDLPPGLSIDWEAYAVMLEESDATDSEKRELIATLWSIVVAFVDLGFGLHPAQQSCGEETDPLSDTPPDLLSLLQEDEMRLREEESP